MAELHDNENLLVRYLDGELSPEEATALEERLRHDGALREELERLQVAAEAIRQYGTAQQVGAIHKEMMQELKPRRTAKVVSLRPRVRAALAVAASVLVLFFALRYFLNAAPTAEEMYQEAFVDYRLSTSRGTGETESGVEKLYRQKDYAAVTAQTRSLNLSAKDSLLIGLSYLQENQAAKATGFFERIAFSDNDFRQDGEFYLALSYLKENRYRQALPLLRTIAGDTNHLYHAQVSPGMVEQVAALEKK